MYGVSPAFTISLFGDGFTASQMADSITRLPSLGFSAYQPEIYRDEELEPWLAGGATQVAAAGVDAGLTPTQFVAHFLLHSFGDTRTLRSERGIDEFAGVCEVCSRFSGMDVITVPLPAFADDGAPFTAAYGALLDKLARMGEVARRTGYRIALEVLPGSLLGGPAGVAPLIERLGGAPFGYNLDPGHVWASRDNPAWVAERLGDAVFGTHLCDNDGITNESRGPGRGTIDWNRLLRALDSIGYSGSYDIEIHTAAERVPEEYRAAREFLQDRRRNSPVAG